MSSIIIPSPEELRHILQNANPGMVFSADVKRQTAGIISGKYIDQAIYRRDVDGITIDGPTTLDADDAIWCEKGKNGYRVYVTITDISEVVDIFSPLDIEAITRATSIYMNPGEIPMFPESLSHDKFSLNGKRKHLALTVAFDVSNGGKIRALNPFESRLHHRGKFTHEQASQVLGNPDERDHAQLALLSEIASLINRAEKRDLGFSGLSEQSPMNINESNNPHFRIHKIIETFMVAANRIVARELSVDSDGIFRQHIHPLERAFYSSKIGPHTGLGIKSGGYTHFTSPLRRYADFLAHKLLKCKIRNEATPYLSEHIHVIIDYINRRVLEIDTIQQYRKNEEAGLRSIDKIRARYGRNPRAHELKQQIRRTANEPYLLPHQVRACILDDIEDPDSKNWQWAVGIILLGNDSVLKQALWDQVIVRRAMPPLSFLNSLAETRLILGEDKVFRVHEITEANSFIVKIELQDGKILSVKKPFSRKYNLNHIRGKARRDLMFKVFRYYMGN